MATLKDTFSTIGTATITLTSLANSSVGVGRVSNYVDNTSTRYLSANVYVKVTVGTLAVSNSPIYLYLSRSDNGGINDDNNGTVDAAGTVINTPLLGVINVGTTTANLAYYGVFDTSALGPLGPAFGFTVVNNSGHPLNGTAAQHSLTYIGVTKDIT